jgi:hypothetical protein
MATLSELINVVAAVEGIDPDRAAAIGRSVREAGLIATKGRGRSAAQMTERDATNLLIAVNTAETAAGATKSVSEFRSLRAKNKTRTTEFGHQLEQLLFAAKMEKIPDYVVQLIDAFGWPRNLLARRKFEPQTYAISIEFGKPTPTVEVRIKGGQYPEYSSVSFEGQAAQAANADQTIRTTITERTIAVVGELLRG